MIQTVKAQLLYIRNQERGFLAQFLSEHSQNPEVTGNS